MRRWPSACARRVSGRRFRCCRRNDSGKPFFSCWTRKEAIAKALGDGLASGLRSLEVCFPDDRLPDGRVGLREASGREWSVLNLPLDAGWRGALAAEGQDWRWQGWCWTRLSSFSLPFSS
ncbi:4'-phosphopantetheinyl transferase superfamily protein [Candidatus Competibacter phosphatis]|uniref:4'-phosphopantetheinyl transferase superfamily protein n=1 Tax=Candidatus Competibacter phosphatis TaxID=221280 RepID=A0ABX1TLB8_9GAMM|nr:4'-phosphopantetheinyl transferase superfamily protein [Candidatus Competibacter phosphatis]NMQ19449.1 4'-phosphopantetheinyl transferase superfamily protein [Candidatus Competibacter phosphatis]